MTWTDRISDLKTCKIQSTSEKALTEDFAILFSDINGEEFMDKSQILIHISATNGNIFISAYDHKAEEVYDDKGVFVELPEFWEENTSAYDFDEIAIRALRSAYKKSHSTVFRSKFEVFYQTEVESEAQRL